MTLSTEQPAAYSFAQLPKAGLGNMLFIWARALVFAHLNGIPLLTSSWVKLRIGPLIRREYSTRLYWRQFRAQSSLPLWRQWYVRGCFNTIVEPTLQQLSVRPRTLYCFDTIPHWSEFFVDLRPHRELIKRELYQLIAPSLRREVERQPQPCIAVHVRHGDFQPLSPGTDFRKVGSVRTPLDYFINRIHAIRALRRQFLPVTIFSDGTDKDLAPLLALPATERVQKNADVVDLLLLSRSKLLIASAGSTFSYWAGFLADAPILLHPDHIHETIRPDDINQHYFEGGVGEDPYAWPALLRRNIQDLIADMT